MKYEIKERDKYQYVDEGQGETLLLLHGFFGELSNFEYVVDAFKSKYRVVVPILPLLSLDLLHTSVTGLAKFVQKFIELQQLEHIHLLGNSLGGHVALLYTLKYPETVKSLILTGSSGLFENGMGDTYPKRGDYEYIRRKTAMTFYDPNVATKELVDEVFSITTNRLKAVKIIALAKSAIRNNLENEVGNIKVPTCLIWGKNDIVTPPFVAEEFKNLITTSELHFIDKCGHAPMMEVPSEFNTILSEFLAKHTQAVEVVAQG